MAQRKLNEPWQHGFYFFAKKGFYFPRRTGNIFQFEGVLFLNFNAYRDSIKELQNLAANYTRLNKSDLDHMKTLNEKCLSMKEEAILSFSGMVEKVEEGLTGLIDRFEQIKKELAASSGPQGTLEDALRLEPAWLQTNDLYSALQLLTGMESPPVKNESAPAAGQPEARDQKQPQGVQGLIAAARKEAAAAVEKPAVNIKAAPAGGKPATINQVKLGQSVRQDNKKSPAAKKEQKPVSGVFPAKPLPVAKVCGEAEQKLMEEINKNIEMIKSKKK
jgi:hypothetical protein